MKHYLYYVLGLCLVLGAASCKKDEPNQNPPKPTPVAPVEEKIPEGVTATYWQVEGKSTDGKESQRLSLDFRPDGTYSVTYRTGAGESEARGLQSARALEWEVYSFSGKYSYRDGKLTILTIEYDRADGVEAGSPKIEEMKGYAQSLVGRVFRVNESERTLTLTDEKPSPSAGDVTGPFRLFILTPATSTPTVKSALESAKRRVDSLSRLLDAAAQEYFTADKKVIRLKKMVAVAYRDSLHATSPEEKTRLSKLMQELVDQQDAAENLRDPLYDRFDQLESAFWTEEAKFTRLQENSGVAASPEGFVGSWRFYDRYERNYLPTEWTSVYPLRAEITPFIFEKYITRVKLFDKQGGRKGLYMDAALGVELKELRINADGTGYAEYRNSNPSLIYRQGDEFRIDFRYRMLSDRSLEIDRGYVFGNMPNMASERYLLTLMTDGQGQHHLQLSLPSIRIEASPLDRPEERGLWLFNARDINISYDFVYYEVERAAYLQSLYVIHGYEFGDYDRGVWRSYTFRRAQ